MWGERAEGGWCVVGKRKKMMKRRCDQCFRTLRLLPSLSEPPPFVPGLFPPNPPPPSRRSSSALIAVTGLSLNLLLFWLCLLTLFLSLRVLLAGARKPKLAIPRSEKEKEEVSIPQLLPLRTWQPFFSSPRDQTDKIVVRTPLKEDLDPR